VTILLKQIFGFLKLLNSDTGTNQLAAGIACGMILGFSPAFSLQTLLVFICIFFLQIQIGAAFIFAFFFAFVAWIFDPIFHSIGVMVLEADGLNSLFTTLYNMPIIPFTKFNNTVVMGSGIVAILLAPFMFILAKFLITKYREKVVEKFKETKFWKFIKATALFKWYAKYDSMFG
jgi:uncharacterized protein (TIGR03546 family)